MRTSLVFAPMALALIVGLAAGCSRHDNADVGQDLKSTGHDISQEAGKVGHDPDVRAAESSLKAAGHDLARDVGQAGQQARSAAHDVAGQAKKAGHDVSRDTHNDQNSQSDTQRNSNG